MDAEEAGARRVTVGLQTMQTLGIKKLTILSDCRSIITRLAEKRIDFCRTVSAIAHGIIHLSNFA